MLWQVKKWETIYKKKPSIHKVLKLWYKNIIDLFEIKLKRFVYKI